jgi:hypothetical protein
LALVLVTVAASACVGHAIQQSHIDGNVPPPGEFARLLQRDLDAYFGTALAPSGHVKVEMLRDGPTQSGVSYPKYYVWVTVPLSGGGTRQGAARLAAVDKERFAVTDFLSYEEVKQNPQRIYRTFPKPVCERINSKVGVQ